MNAELFIRRPITTTLVMCAILLAGIMGYRALPVNDLPNVDFPTLSVSASLPGANPETMASAVATPLERQFSTIAGLAQMNSVNAQGSTAITLTFSLDRDIDAAAQDVQAAISQAQGQLPQDMPTPPSFKKVNPADQPILYVALFSDTLPLSDVNEFADTYIAQRVSMVSGVAQVQIYGQQKYAVRAQIDPRVLINRQIGIDEVASAIQNANVNLPTGDLQGTAKAFTVQASGQLTDAGMYRPVIVAYRNGAPVRLGELGVVLDSVQDNRSASWYTGKRAIVLAIQRQPGTNTVAVVDAIKQLLPQIKQQMPAGMNLAILYDRSQSIRESIHDVKFTFMLTIALVVLVIFLFLRNISATIIPALALPMSVVGTFAIMYLFGYSLNNLSLMALTLSVGFVVDDAIVMLENIVRHMEHGESPMQAAFKGSREIAFTIVSMTISLTAVFIPVLFMGGIIGRLLHEFAVTISAAILVSGFVSLTLTPMLCSRFLRPPKAKGHGRLFNFFEHIFDGLLRWYEATLKLALRFRFFTFMISIVMLALTVVMFKHIPTGFLPTEDNGLLLAFTKAIEGISFEDMVRHQQALAEIVAQDPSVTQYMSGIGGGGINQASNAGRIFMTLRPRRERPSADAVIERLRPKLAQIPGIRAFLQVPPTIRIGGQLTESQYQFTLQSPDTDALYASAQKFTEKLRDLGGVRDVSTDLQISNPQVQIEILRDKASALGVSAQKIESALSMAYGGREISTIYAPENSYKVMLELLPQYQRDPTVLSLLYVRSSAGQLVPLSTVARISRDLGPLTVNHQGQLPAVTVSFNLEPGVSLGTAVERVQELARQTLPGTVTTSFQGTAQAFTSSLQGLGLLLLAAILVIYIVLGILYESYIHPITILSGLPSAGVGALLTLMVFGKTLDLYGFVGIIMLVGIVKKNAIMMIDFALEAQRKEGKSPEAAIFEGCLVRFRPIMMTTMAALMGTLPIAIGYGAGAEARQPLGLAVVGGLVLSQFITLYITPVYYIYLDRLAGFARRGKLGTKTEVEKGLHGGGALGDAAAEPASH
jgi:HAE1 family hydrophobic/amphiphilic exporter-1